MAYISEAEWNMSIEKNTQEYAKLKSHSVSKPGKQPQNQKKTRQNYQYRA